MTILLLSRSSLADWTSTNWPQQSGSSLIIQYGSKDDEIVEVGRGELGTDCGSERLLGAVPAPTAPPAFCCIIRAKAAAKPDALVSLVEGRVEMEEL